MTSARRTIIQASQKLLRPPFIYFLALNLFVQAVILSIQPDDAGSFSLLLLAAVGAYLHIGMILAAAAAEPGTGIDPWLRAAFRQRCFWRLAFTELFTLLLVAAGLLLLIIPGLLVGAAVALGPQAAVFEGMWPGNAVRRSVELTRPVRQKVGVLFALFSLVPVLLTQIGYFLEWNKNLEVAWYASQGAYVVLTNIGLIALTRAYVELSGASKQSEPATS